VGISKRKPEMENTAKIIPISLKPKFLAKKNSDMIGMIGYSPKRKV
jgi:hypothetical protein